MGFDDADYRRAHEMARVPIPHMKAMIAVESSGETFWEIDGERVVPQRFEAHWFGRLSGYRFNASHPDLSCVQWTPNLAARTRAGAVDQVRRAAELDRPAALGATSWGGPQIMGFHWKALGYASVQAFVDSMSDRGDDGQMDAFVKFIMHDRVLLQALRDGKWDVVELRYNGGGYGGAYARKLEAAVRLYRDPAMPAPRLLKLGDVGPDVSALRQALGLAANDNFDPATDAAVRAVQVRKGLTVDGMVGRMTRAALGLAA